MFISLKLINWLRDCAPRTAMISRPRRDAGASLVEYALLVALIAVVCIAAIAVFGEETGQSFSRAGSSLSGT